MHYYINRNVAVLVETCQRIIEHRGDVVFLRDRSAATEIGHSRHRICRRFEDYDFRVLFDEADQVLQIIYAY